MPTSAEDPQLAKQQRDVLAAAEGLKEREWLPLWLAGPILALMCTVGLIALVMMVAEIGRRLS